jgi:hypothetical protein
MEDALTSMVVKGKLDFGSLADSIVADITRIAIKQAILAPLASAMFGQLGGAAAGAAVSSAAGDIAKAAVGDATATSGGSWLSGIGKSVGNWLASIFHEGGVVGEGAPPRRPVDAALFLQAPRYHTGGLAGAYVSGALRPDEMPAILQRGEMVLSRSQVAKRMNEPRAAAPVNVVMNITTPDVGGFRASQGQLAADAARTLARVQRRNL